MRDIGESTANSKLEMWNVESNSVIGKPNINIGLHH